MIGLEVAKTYRVFELFVLNLGDIRTALLCDVFVEITNDVGQLSAENGF